MPSYQTIASVCVAIAALIFLLPLQNLLWDYAHQKQYSDGWEPAVLFILIPLWLLLMGALLCVTASGGFDWLRLGRPALYALTVAAAVALAVVSMVLVAMYIRPGFSPRIIYSPPLYLIHLGTLLLVLVSLYPQFALVVSPQAVRWPWTIFAALSIVACVGVFGYWLVNTGVGSVAQIAHQLRNPGPSAQEIITKISTLDPENHFDDLLGWTTRHDSPEVREAATARLRTHPRFVEIISTTLETGHFEPAAEFLYSATLSAAEQARFARAARVGMQRWVGRIPAPNYTTKEHLKRVNRWGSEVFGVLTAKFASTGVDFAPVIDDFKDKVEPSRRNN